MNLPWRSTPRTLRPASPAEVSSGFPRNTRRHRNSALTMLLPCRCGASARAMVSTSGSSGTVRQEGRFRKMSPPSIFTSQVATLFAGSMSFSPVAQFHSHACHGQTTFEPLIAPWPSGPPRCGQTPLSAVIFPPTLQMAYGVSATRTSVTESASIPAAGATLTNGMDRSILRHFRIDLVAPRQNPALHVLDLLEAGLFQEVDGLGAAHAALAVSHDLIRGIQLVDAFGQF